MRHGSSSSGGSTSSGGTLASGGTVLERESDASDSCTPGNLVWGPRKCKGQSAFSQCFSRAKRAALGGLEPHVLCLGREVAPAAADLAGAGLTG
jgi:hypothetical protein